MITKFKLFENSKYKPILTNKELVYFILDNDLRDSNGALEYDDAKEIAYWSSKGIWVLKELELNKKGLNLLYPKKPKTLGIPVIVIHNIDNDSYEILDGKHRIGYSNYINSPSILAYVCENEKGDIKNTD
jgi:hypothetical protein